MDDSNYDQSGGLFGFSKKKKLNKLLKKLISLIKKREFIKPIIVKSPKNMTAKFINLNLKNLIISANTKGKIK